MKEMKIMIKNMLCLFLLAGMASCSKKNENYKALIKNGEIHYPGVISNAGYLAGNLRTMLKFNPGPDPKIAKYVIYWNNKQDSMTVSAVSHNPLDTVKVLVPGLSEGTYNFNIYSFDTDGNRSIMTTVNSVRVYGPVYLSGLFNRGYNADTPYLFNVLKGFVQLKYNKPDSINIETVVNYTDNNGAAKSVLLNPDSSMVTLPNFKIGSDVTYQSSYIPQKGAIDTFTVTGVTKFPPISRAGDITQFAIKNPGNPFLRSDEGQGKWGVPKDWQVTPNVINQDGGKGGGYSTDYGGVIHFEAKDYSGDPIINGKVFQSITLPAGDYQYDVTSQNYGGDINANEVVVLGTSLPDINNLNGNPSVLAMFHGDGGNIGNTHSMYFSLSKQTTITIGWVVSLQSYTYLQFRNVSLKILN
jgi:hypothetical protein